MEDFEELTSEQQERLKAAAPDLLRACIRAESAMDCNQYTGAYCAGSRESALHLLREAIKKATEK